MAMHAFSLNNLTPIEAFRLQNLKNAVRILKNPCTCPTHMPQMYACAHDDAILKDGSVPQLIRQGHSPNSLARIALDYFDRPMSQYSTDQVSALLRLRRILAREDSDNILQKLTWADSGRVIPKREIDKILKIYNELFFLGQTSLQGNFRWITGLTRDHQALARYAQWNDGTHATNSSLPYPQSLETAPSTRHPRHGTLDTAPSTRHPRHGTLDTAPSTHLQACKMPPNRANHTTRPTNRVDPTARPTNRKKRTTREVIAKLANRVDR
ncbi:hypothetical protein M011DRAFT_477553 [Sporormia fimetaria CBS 119925]|uniref:Uncharacterized protein n=1 Tax=Sporormia fimetaria CBS 119925 TaxID=1340428 RepID=A0A6A6VBL1_9PLEO|nr:hypothetical protein M011DRAFT_477553 [Sporormia fimetaria CBS 119925]